MENNTVVHATASGSVQVCYEVFLAMCEERKWKVGEADNVKRAVRFTFGNSLTSPRLKMLAEFVSPTNERTNLRLTATHSDIADWSDALSSSVVEPFLDRLGSRLQAEAQTILAGRSADDVLRVQQPVSAGVEAALKELRGNLSAYARKDAAAQLGAVDGNSERVVAALIVARETDQHDSVRSKAAEALQGPGPQAILQANPDWAAQVMALTKIQASGQMQAERVARATSRNGRSLITTGVILLIMGSLALLMPLFGYELMWMGFIHTGRPIIGILMLAAGLGMVVLGSRSR